MEQKTFDGIIKANLLKSPKYNENDFEYRKGEYENYFEKSVFEQFVRNNKLPKYAGDELGEKGKRPPKMASVGSSSRFCYLALKDWAENKENGIEFEKECKIEGIGGIPPQLDAYIAKGNIYVEAKCHEIFSPHSIVMATTYKDLLCENFGLKEDDFGKTTVKRKRKNQKYKKGENPSVDEYIKVDVEMLTISPNIFGVNKNETMFDIKQLLCHLMGINSQKTGKAKLVYMFFKPLCDNEELDKVFEELEGEINTIFECPAIKGFCDKSGIKLCAIVQNTLKMETLIKEPKKNYDYLYGDESKS